MNSREVFRESNRQSRCKRIAIAISIGAALAMIHYLIRRHISNFSVLYDGLPRPEWISIAIDGEFVMHLLFLGALFSVTWRSIPALEKPKYSNDGTYSVFNSNAADEPIDWPSLIGAWASLPIYLLLWAWAYGYL